MCVTWTYTSIQISKYFICVFMCTSILAHVLSIPDYHGFDLVVMYLHCKRDATWRKKWFGWFKRWALFMWAVLETVLLKITTTKDYSAEQCWPRPLAALLFKKIMEDGEKGEPTWTRFLSWRLALTQTKDRSFEEIGRNEDSLKSSLWFVLNNAYRCFKNFSYPFHKRSNFLPVFIYLFFTVMLKCIVLLSAFYTWGNWVLERVRNEPIVTQPVSGRNRIWSQAVRLQIPSL